jgi:hypothetical protein
MGMIGNLLRVSNAELESYLGNSSLLENRIYEDASEKGDPGLTDIDKAWNGILFLLTGQNLDELDHPLARVLFSGQIIDAAQDLGYGPGHYLTPRQVKEVHADIAGITPADLSSKYDAEKMTALDIYPTIWDEEDAMGYLLEHFKTIKEVYATASKNGEAIITFIN